MRRLLVIGLLGLAGIVHAADWYMFRGNPELTGVAEGKFPESPELLWSFKTDGPVLSSAAIVGGVVYFGSSDEHVYAVDLKTGKKKWSFKAEEEGDAFEGSPMILDGIVYIGSLFGTLYALDQADGKKQWAYGTNDKIVGGPNWTMAPDGKTKRIVFGSYDNLLHCVDPKTGKKIWTYETDNYINGTPTVANNHTYFGGCDALIHMVSLTDGTKKKSIELESYVAGSGAFVDGKLYVGHYGNGFLAADLEAGKVKWEYAESNLPFVASPAVLGKKVVSAGRDKHVYCWDTETGKLQWKFRTRGRIDSSPVICDGKVIVGSDDGRVYILKLDDGSKIWSYEIGQAIGASPSIADGKLIIGSADGSVYAFGSKN
jgi:outer membrane protein assembly factor BamB